MASIKFEVIAVIGKYKNANGDDKNRYTKIGVVIQTEKVLRLKLETMPVVWDGWAMLVDPKPKEATKEDGGLSDMKDDIPW